MPQINLAGLKKAYGNVTVIEDLEGRDLAVGAVTKKAKNLYWAFAQDGSNAR